MSLVPVGYPDFSRRSARSDQLLFDGFIGPAAPVSVTPLVSVAGTASLGVSAFGTAGNLVYSFAWFLDAAGLTFLASQNMHVMANGSFDGSIPCLGPYVRVAVTGVFGTEQHQFKLWTAWQPGPHSRDLDRIQLIAIDNVAVGAGAATTRNAAIVWPGTAVLNIRTALATFTVDMTARLADGTTPILGRWNNAGGLSQNHTIAVPMDAIRVTATNTTAAAGTISVFVTAAAFGPIL